MIEPQYHENGRLRTCAEGWDLYQEYCRLLDDDEKCWTLDFEIAWDKWKAHKKECLACDYVK